MKKFAVFLSGVLLIIGFQNCGKTTFASSGDVGSLGEAYGCFEMMALSRFGLSSVKELTYDSERTSSSPYEAQAVHRKVVIRLDHAQSVLIISPGVYGQKPDCALTLKGQAYEDFINLLSAPRLVHKSPTYKLQNVERGYLELNVNQRRLTYEFEHDDSHVEGDVIVDGAALESKLREYMNLSCPIAN